MKMATTAKKVDQPDWTELAYFYYDKLVEFVYDILRVEKIDPQQEKVLRAIETERAVAVKAGHGVGKTAVESWVCNWFMFTRPNCRIPCTAPTGAQLNDILWPEIKKWYDNSYLSDYDLFEWTKRRFSFNDDNYKDTWFAVPRSTNKPENLQGFHAEEVLFIIDEASGVPQNIMEVVEGALTNDGAKLIMFGNPTQITGTFYDAFNKDRKFFCGITLNSEESTLVSKEYVERIYNKYGKHSNVARVRVRGEFPTQEPDTIIPINLVEKAAMTEVEGKSDYIDIGVDVARFGDDETTFYVRRGMEIIEHHIQYHKRTTQVSSFAATLAKKYNTHYTVRIKVDSGSMGAGVIDELLNKNLLNTDIYEIGFGENAVDEEKYYNRATELYFNFRDILEKNQVYIPNDEELRNQLAARKYTIDSKKDRFRIEPKDQFKKRTGNSPDRADGLVLCFYNPDELEIDLTPSQKPYGF